MKKEHPAYHEGYKDGYGHGHKDGTKGKPKGLKTGGRAEEEGIDEDKTEPKPHPYNAVGSHDEDEAEERKHGGRLKRKHGGAAKAEGHAEGHEAKVRHDRMPRKSGGRTVNMDKSPFSEANRIHPASGREKGVDGDLSSEGE